MRCEAHAAEIATAIRDFLPADFATRFMLTMLGGKASNPVPAFRLRHQFAPSRPC
jgi:hypothetical protein